MGDVNAWLPRRYGSNIYIRFRLFACVLLTACSILKKVITGGNLWPLRTCICIPNTAFWTGRAPSRSWSSGLKELGQTHCAITDHGVMYGVVDFYSACKAEGIHPVIGVEAYICPDRFDKSVVSREYSHLILLCENQTGIPKPDQARVRWVHRGLLLPPKAGL